MKELIFIITLKMIKHLYFIDLKKWPSILCLRYHLRIEKLSKEQFCVVSIIMLKSCWNPYQLAIVRMLYKVQCLPTFVTKTYCTDLLVTMTKPIELQMSVICLWYSLYYIRDVNWFVSAIKIVSTCVLGKRQILSSNWCQNRTVQQHCNCDIRTTLCYKYFTYIDL